MLKAKQGYALIQSFEVRKQILIDFMNKFNKNLKITVIKTEIFLIFFRLLSCLNHVDLLRIKILMV